MLTDYQEQAHSIQQQFKQQQAAILKDVTLTDVGKRQKLEALEAQRQGKVSELRAEAETKLTRARGGVELQLQWEGEKLLEHRLKLFGPQVVADMIRHSLETLDAPGIAQAYREAATDFEREAIAIYGRSILQARAGSAPTPETLAALQILNQGEPETVIKARAELREIDRALGNLDALDVETTNNRLADAYGVNPALIMGK